MTYLFTTQEGGVLQKVTVNTRKIKRIIKHLRKKYPNFIAIFPNGITYDSFFKSVGYNPYSRSNTKLKRQYERMHYLAISKQLNLDVPAFNTSKHIIRLAMKKAKKELYNVLER